MKMEYDFTDDFPYAEADGPAMLLRLVQALKGGETVDPAVAEWFCEAHERGRLTLSRLRPGRPQKIPRAKLRQAMNGLAEAKRKGATAASAAATVSAALKLSIDKAFAQNLLEADKEIRQLDNACRVNSARELAILEFRARRLLGILGEQALREVGDIRDWPTRPDLELLQLYQIQEESWPGEVRKKSK